MLERVNHHKQDLDNLISTAKHLFQEHSHESMLSDLSTRFSKLESRIGELHEHYMKLIERWRKFMERKKKMREILQKSRVIASMKSIGHSDEATVAASDCQVCICFSWHVDQCTGRGRGI